MESRHIRVNNIDCCFGERTVFQNLSFDSQQSEFLSIVGPSGSGKSSLLRMLAGLLSPTRGSIEGLSVSSKVRSAFVFQEPNLLPWRNSLENVLLPFELLPNTLNVSDQKNRALFWLNKLGLSHAISNFPDELSGGMKMRVSLARALVMDPDVLFMDEPFSALDEPQREILNLELRHLFETRMIRIFFVTHSLSEAAFLSDRIIYLGSQNKEALTIFSSPLPAKGRTLEQRYSSDFNQLTRELFEMSQKT